MTDEMNLETTFNAAADIVQNSSSNGIATPSKILLELYGLYKVVTTGKCNQPQPNILNSRARAKWNSWEKVSSLSKIEAMKKYVELVKTSFVWEPLGTGGPNDCLAAPSSTIGNTVSTMAYRDEDFVEDGEDVHPVFNWAKDCDLHQLRKWAVANPDEVNVKDKNGLTPLLWAIDRGHLSAVQLLIGLGADPLLSDDDGILPLEYAETCEHDEIVNFLNNSKN